MHGARSIGSAWILAAVAALVGCGDGDPGREPEVAGAATGRPSVYAVNYPLAYFATRIGGDGVRVEFPAPSGIDPAHWKPGPEEVAAFQQADLVLLNGADYAKWVSWASLPPSRLVDTSEGFRERYIPVEGVVTHSHGPEGEHEHGGVAFTTWLDFELALEQARAVEAAFRKAFPERSATFAAGLGSLEGDLRELDRRIRETVGEARMPLLGSHPVYQYLAAGYGLEIRCVHFEPGEPPSAAEWAKLEALLAERPARWMLWEGPPLDETVQRLRAAGVESVVFDPCGNRPDAGDFLTVQRANVENLRRIFSQGS